MAMNRRWLYGDGRMFFILFILVFLLWGVFSVHAAQPIKLGSSLCISSERYQSLCKDMKLGAMLFFREINDSGGIRGSEIQFLVKDDGYRADKALVNVKELVLKDGVIGLVATGGTSVSLAVATWLKGRGIPLVAPLTGAEVVYKVNPSGVFTLLPFYSSEVQTLVERAVKDGAKVLGVVYPKSPYGWSCALAVKRVLKRFRGVMARWVGLAKGETLNLKDVARLASSNALLLFYTPSDLLTKLEIMGKFPPLYASQYSLAEKRWRALDKDGRGSFKLVVSRLLPIPREELPVTVRLREALARYYPDKKVNNAILQGYLAAMVVVEGLKRGRSFTPQGLIQGLESIRDLDLGLPEKISYSSTDHVGLEKVYLYLCGEEGYQKLLP